jgi:CO/xanthine dehydrogenase Mo-binding subunit
MGALVQGIGQALYENAIYDDESGQLKTGAFMDYCMPRADNIPFKLETNTTSGAQSGRQGLRRGRHHRRAGAIMNRW